MAKFYAVQVGLTPGVYKTWAECETMVKGYPGARYKSFPTEGQAHEFAFGKKLPSTATPNPTNIWYVYVDGSYKNGRYSWAYAVVRNDELQYESYGVGTNLEAAETHNIAGELAASMRASKWAQANGKAIVIKHDLEGTAFWAQGAWKRNNDTTRKYHEFMKDYKEIVAFEWVRGHNGDKWNEYVDDLASRAHEEF